jgi:hypothetical protein
MRRGLLAEDGTYDSVTVINSETGRGVDIPAGTSTVVAGPVLSLLVDDNTSRGGIRGKRQYLSLTVRCLAEW